VSKVGCSAGFSENLFQATERRARLAGHEINDPEEIDQCPNPARWMLPNITMIPERVRNI
jgi:hypothetical protein